VADTDLPVVVLQGAAFDDFAGFVKEFSRHLDEFEWRGSLDALNDILRGGCGTPDGGFELQWLNSAHSRLALGWPATVRWLEETLTRCHHTNVPHLKLQLDAARREEGTTLFDWIIEIINVHGPGGSEPEGNVRLALL
jgi:hypothetical protein